MKSENFEFIRDRWPELATLGAFAEAYCFTDATSALVKLRSFAEQMTRGIYAAYALPKPINPAFVDLLRDGAFCAVVPMVVLDKLHALRTNGNKAAHGEPAKPQTVLWLLKEAYDLARWLAVNFSKAEAASLPSFKEPQRPAQGPDVERLRKSMLEKLAAQEAQLNAALAELEAARRKAEAAEQKIADFDAASAQAKKSADTLKFDEATTRARIIDHAIASVGWGVGAESTPSVGKEVEVSGQPTKTGIGYVDYVLFDDDGAPIGLIEAKKASVDPEAGRKQAKLYADALEKQYGVRPAIFYTNGYDIWLWDDASGYPPRKLYGFYSKDSLQLVRYQRAARKPLNSFGPDASIVERLYQVEAIKRVSERFESKHRKALIVQATGTGKTRVAIALADLLIKAGWVKRVLFLCDRRELRKQAKNAFTTFLPTEPIRVVDARLTDAASERIFLATYPGMMRVYQAFDVGYFDLIIADESHRSIFNVYGDLFRYFDALQVGLTATPVNYVTRNTFDLFDCEGQLPTSNYDLETAVEEKHLVPFEVFDHSTQFLRDGITLDVLSEEQIEELEEQGEDPNSFDFAAEEIDRAIYNKDTNRLVLRNLMENGIRAGDGQTIGKSIIFARNHEHALLLSRLFDEMYPQYGGQFCQVIDNYDPRAEQLIDDFKGEGDNKQLTIAISVDMLDTGIDVPEVLNLVFAKPVKSPVKFWQMIGRGTRLCPNLFGPGKHKTVFRIFDHWQNFERFEQGYQPAEPGRPKSTLELLFEERLTLAETALRESDIATFKATAKLIEADIADLPEESIAVKDRWRERRHALEEGRIEKFDPAVVALMRGVLAPLMQWRTGRGVSDAHSFDLLVTRMQVAALTGAARLQDLRIDFLERIGELRMNLNPVKERADVLKKVKSPAFWNDVSAAKLEDVRLSLRDVMHLRDSSNGGPLPPKTIDVTENADHVALVRRATNLRSIELEAYKQLIEAELKKHFETDPTLKKIRAGEPVEKHDVDALVSLVLTQNPLVDKDALEAFFADRRLPLDAVIRSIVGSDPEAVKAKFAKFVAEHPTMTAKQTRFLALLQNHIIKFGFITIDRLYDQPFTVIDADGPDGVFERAEDIDHLLELMGAFAPLHGSAQRGKRPDEGTQGA